MCLGQASSQLSLPAWLVANGPHRYHTREVQGNKARTVTDGQTDGTFRLGGGWHPQRLRQGRVLCPNNKMACEPGCRQVERVASRYQLSPARTLRNWLSAALDVHQKTTLRLDHGLVALSLTKRAHMTQPWVGACQLAKRGVSVYNGSRPQGEPTRIGYSPGISRLSVQMNLLSWSRRFWIRQSLTQDTREIPTTLGESCLLVSA